MGSTSPFGPDFTGMEQLYAEVEQEDGMQVEPVYHSLKLYYVGARRLRPVAVAGVEPTLRQAADGLIFSQLSLMVGQWHGGV